MIRELKAAIVLKGGSPDIVDILPFEGLEDLLKPNGIYFRYPADTNKNKYIGALVQSCSFFSFKVQGVDNHTYGKQEVI